MNSAEFFLTLGAIFLAGTAMGVALAAANHFPQYRQTILSIVISTTVFFELVDPLFTRMAVKSTSD